MLATAVFLLHAQFFPPQPTWTYSISQNQLVVNWRGAGGTFPLPLAEIVRVEQGMRPFMSLKPVFVAVPPLPATGWGFFQAGPTVYVHCSGPGTYRATPAQIAAFWQTILPFSPKPTVPPYLPGKAPVPGDVTQTKG